MQRWIDEDEAMALAELMGYSEEEIEATGLGDILVCAEVDFEQAMYLIEEWEYSMIEKVERYRRRKGDLVLARLVMTFLPEDVQESCSEALHDDKLSQVQRIMLDNWPKDLPKLLDVVRISEDDFAPRLVAGQIYAVFFPGAIAQLSLQDPESPLLIMFNYETWLQWEDSGEPTLLDAARVLAKHHERVAIVTPGIPHPDGGLRAHSQRTLMLDEAIYGVQDDTLLITTKEIS